MERLGLFRYALESDEKNARKAILEAFIQNYSDFFRPLDPLQAIRHRDRILTALDTASYHSGQRDIIHTTEERTKIKVPYSGLEQEILEAIKTDLDPSFSRLPTVRTKGFIPQFPGLLSDELSRALNKPVLLSSQFFVLYRDRYLNRGLQRINVYDALDQQEIGELWVGKKWIDSSDTDQALDVPELPMLAM